MVEEKISIKKFANSYLDRKHFCRYVAQEGYEDFPNSLNFMDLGFRRGAVNSATNYAAPFATAQDLLRRHAQVADNTEIWFITDGEPTTYPGAPDNREDKEGALRAGIAAGKALRDDTSIKNKTINGLYLGIPGTQTYENASSVLEQVTGSRERVAAAENVDQLIERILNFPKARISIDPKKYPQMASHAIEGFFKMFIGIREIQQSGDKWIYETQSFLLPGKKGETVDNIVTIDIEGDDGFKFTSQVIIKHKQK
jgi:hypothetical protein